MSFATKRAAIISWIRGATGYTAAKVIWLDQDMPRPETPYIGARMTSFKNIGREYVDSPDSDGKGKIFKHKEFTLNIHCFGTKTVDPMEVALNIEDAQDKETQKAILEAQQLVIVTTLMGATDTSIKLDTTFESRASIDFKFRSPFEIEDSGQGLIETINVEGSLKNEVELIKTVDFEI